MTSDQNTKGKDITNQGTNGLYSADFPQITGKAADSPLFDQVNDSFVDVIRFRAEHQPNDIAYIYHDFKHKTDITLTFAELANQSQQLAAELINENLSDKNIILFFRPGLDFIISYCACLFSGVIAVPISTPGRDDGAIKQLANICSDAQSTHILLNNDLLDRFKKLQQASDVLNALKILNVSDVLNAPTVFSLSSIVLSNTRVSSISNKIVSNDLAFIQYTSGSTSLPKGVMVTHGNLLANQRMIKENFQHDNSTIVVGWLPTFHDMGLIGNVLQPLFIGRPSILIDPLAFIQKPLRWLQLITRFKATTSGGPNFGYDLCVERVKEADKKSLDLSSWTLAFNGAEPVRKTTLDRFTQAFKECGFDPHAFYPCYGLAESTLFVSGIDKFSEPNFLTLDEKQITNNKIQQLSEKDIVQDAAIQSRVVTSCGKPKASQGIAIVNPDTHQLCEENTVGEIWLQSACNAKGYWKNLEKTAETFQAKIHSFDSTQSSSAINISENLENFMRTGDLGFLNNGELFITGRLKELIIISGKNHYPQDIEETSLAANSSARTACAFSVDINGDEKLVLLQELKQLTLNSDEQQDMIATVRADIIRNHGIKLHDIIFIKPRRLSRTSSGKLQRNKEKQNYLQNQSKDKQVEIETLPITHLEKRA